MNKRKISCLSCRLKKVKCDGESPCQRCQSKGHECIYQKLKAVGRPPKNAVVNKLVLSKNKNESVLYKEFIFENVSNTPDLIPTRYLEDSKLHGLGFYVNQLFFSTYTKLTNHKLHLQNPTNVTSYKIFSLSHYFSWMTADTARILIRRLSRLNLFQSNELQFSQICLRQDCSTTFFEATKPASNPLNSLTPQQAIELIESFFCVHPYAILVNKTMLLQAYWTDTVDPLLLAVIYGTTVYKSQLLEGKPLEPWETTKKKVRNPFLDYAYVLLSKANAEATPTRYQAIVLLAMFEVSFGYPKRGMALFGLSYMLASKLGLVDRTLPPGLNPVEKELLLLTFWAAYNLTLRGCIELDKLPTSSLIYNSLPYPPPTLYQSKSYAFDIENNNPNLSSEYEHLYETFYVQTVISKLTCQLMAPLPNLFVTIVHFKQPVQTNPNPIPIQEKTAQTLQHFHQFIHQPAHTPYQTFTLSLYYHFFSLCLTFLQEPDPDRPLEPELLQKFIPDATQLIESCFEYLCSGETRWMPRGVILNSLDAAIRILMYAEPTPALRHALELAQLSLGLDVWKDWPAALPVLAAVETLLQPQPDPSFDLEGLLQSDLWSLLGLDTFDPSFFLEKK